MEIWLADILYIHNNTSQHLGTYLPNSILFTTLPEFCQHLDGQQKDHCGSTEELAAARSEALLMHDW